MFNCVVSQSLSAINSAAVSIKIISTDLWVFLTFYRNKIWHPETTITILWSHFSIISLADFSREI
jgi:hypothetical protein